MMKLVAMAVSTLAVMPTLPCVAQVNPLLPPAGGRATSVVEQNGSIQYGPFPVLNDDCTRRRNAILRIIKKPQHGRAIISDREGNIRFAEDHPCNFRRIVATTVLYVPRRGYRGPDTLSFTVQGPVGPVRRLAFDISVR
jgi:hypothetical protein